METKSVLVPTPDGQADAYVAYPEPAGRHPAVIFYMDAYGPRPVLHEMAQTIADDGFYVLLPNVFYRSGPAPLFDLPDLHDPDAHQAVYGKVRPLIQALTPEHAVRDAGAYLDFLERQPEVAPGPVGLTGYCMGGGLVVRTAAAYPDRVAAAATFHAGRLATDAADSPHRLLRDVRAELYFAHADDDPSMSAEQIERLETALAEAEVTYTSEVYQGAAHGFTMSDTPAYHAPSLERHWSGLLDLFHRRLLT